ncbi:MAG: hypothetical protein ABI051_10250 [Vicinamibacterales bacterium]
MLNDGIEIGPDDEQLPTASIPAILSAVGPVRDVPFAAVPARFVARPRRRRQRHRHPLARDDLFAVPRAAVKIEVAELRDIPWIEVAIAPPVAAPLRIVTPHDVTHAKRFEQVLASEVQLSLMGRRANCRTDMGHHSGIGAGLSRSLG